MERLVTTHRHRKSSAEHNSILASTQSDRARLIYSAPFRRLQQKAQVFSLESNSAVRSRLTHSLEVSHIGRYVVSQILEDIDKSSIPEKNIIFWKQNSLAISNIVETACLMHDIGNPPFGHFGEAAISQWFSSEDSVNSIRNSLGSDETNEDKIREKARTYDFESFDGNPQGLRIVTKLQGDDGLHGLNLTSTQIAVFLKYTFEASEINPSVPFGKKAGYFSTENDLMNETWNNLNMAKNSRHPLGFLMEASDDISYCISDIEDGIEKGIISEQQFLTVVREHLEKIISNKLILEQAFLRKAIKELTLGVKAEFFSKENVITDLVDKLKNIDTELKNQEPKFTITEKLHSNIVNYKKGGSVGPFISFKTLLSNLLVEFVAKEFIDNYNQLISQGHKKEIIHKDTEEYKVLEILRDFTSQHLFASNEAESIELTGFAAISGLLEDFSLLLEIPRVSFDFILDNKFKEMKVNKLDIHRRLFNLLPEKHVDAYKKASSVEKNDWVEWNLRAHLIVDFISGMTDHFALETFQMLKGIKLA